MSKNRKRVEVDSNWLPVKAKQSNGSELTMSSKDIADMVGSRHDKVKQSIERLATVTEKQAKEGRKPVLDEFPPMGVIPTATKPMEVYLLNERSSYIVVAQLSPEFTARLVDEWQRLKEEASKPTFTLPDFNNPIEAARAWADQLEGRQLAESTVQEQGEQLQLQAPKVKVYDTMVDEGTTLSATEAADALNLPSAQAVTKLVSNLGWIDGRTVNCIPSKKGREFLTVRWYKTNSGRRIPTYRVKTTGVAALIEVLNPIFGELSD